MGEITTTNLPGYVADASTGNSAQRPSPEPAFIPAAPQDDLPLTKLNAILSGLKNGAAAMRFQIDKVKKSVRTGTYQVDPMRVSQSIVGDCLSSY